MDFIHKKILINGLYFLLMDKIFIKLLTYQNRVIDFIV